MKHLITILFFVTHGAFAQIDSDDGLTMKNPKNMNLEQRFELLKTIEVRMKELKVKQLEVQKFKDELDIQKAGIEERVKYLERLKVELAEKLDNKMEKDIQALKEMTKMYEGMKAKKAAGIIEKIDIDMARIILQLMNKKKASAILDGVSEEKAIKLSEHYAGFSSSQKNKTMDSVKRSPSFNKQGDTP